MAQCKWHDSASPRCYFGFSCSLALGANFLHAASFFYFLFRRPARAGRSLACFYLDDVSKVAPFCRACLRVGSMGFGC